MGTAIAVKIPDGTRTVIPMAPGAPRSLSASYPSPGYATLSWQAPLSTGGAPLTGYKIYRAPTPGSFSYLASVGSGTTTYDVSRASDYYYRVTATSSAGEGAPSNEIFVSLLTPTVTFTVASAEDDGQATSGWGACPYPGGGSGSSAGQTATVVRDYDPENGCRVQNALVRFDTSSIPDNAVVLSATLKLYIDNKYSQGGLSAQAEYYSAWPIDGADYSAASANSAHAGTPITNLATGAYNNFTLQNLSSVSRTGYTGFRLHVSGALSYGPSSNQNYYSLRPYEHWSPAPPQLVVTYALP